MFEPASSQTNQKEGEGKENEEELELPRSYSIPNLSYNAEQKEYQYEITRDFRAEVQNYMALKKRLEKKKAMKKQQSG